MFFGVLGAVFLLISAFFATFRLKIRICAADGEAAAEVGARFLYFFEPERILSICKKGGKWGLFAFGIKIAPDFKKRRRKTKTQKNSEKSVKNASKTVKKGAKKRSKTKRKFLAWLFKHIKVRKLKIKAVIGTGDAASSALICGITNAVLFAAAEAVCKQTDIGIGFSDRIGFCCDAAAEISL